MYKANWSVLHIELARMPNRYRALSHKMADLYAKSSNKRISLEIDHSRQICKSEIKKI